MNPAQLRETTIHPDTRLVQLTVDEGRKTDDVMDMLLAKKRAPDRRAWLKERRSGGNRLIGASEPNFSFRPLTSNETGIFFMVMKSNRPHGSQLLWQRCVRIFVLATYTERAY